MTADCAPHEKPMRHILPVAGPGRSPLAILSRGSRFSTIIGI